MTERSRGELLQQIAESRRKMGDGPSDMEIAMHWVREMKYPCSDPKNPEINMGNKWYREAKRTLDLLKEKPINDQNPHAIKMLERGIREYEIENDIKNDFKN